MTCCECNAERWERENAEGRAAALANPDEWISVGTVEDAGDIGGDVQAGPAWSKHFYRWMPAVGRWALMGSRWYFYPLPVVVQANNDVDESSTPTRRALPVPASP